MATYKQALELAGYEVESLQYFGTDQGTWIAKLKDGTFIEGCFGSCADCDRIKSLQGYDRCEIPDKELKEFGEGYTAKTKESLVKQYTEQAKWDVDAEEVLKFLQGE